MSFRVFLIPLLFIHYLYAYDIAVPSMKKDGQINFLTNIINNCYSDMKASIFIANSLANSRSKGLYKETIGSLTLLENSTNYNIPANQRVPISLIILVLTSPAEIKDIFINETWRNFDQSFIIMDGDSDNGCRNAHLFLMEAWKNDLLNVIFMCLDHQHRIPKIYSFNPFTDFASSPWQKVSVVPAINNHLWTLFSQRYSTDNAVCRNLFFDKTENLGGYNIKMGAQYVMPYFSYSFKNGNKHFEGFDFEIVKLLFGKLNVSVSFQETESEILRALNKQIRQKLLSQLGKKSIDFVVSSLVLRSYVKAVEPTYAFYQTDFSVITQRREFKKILGHLFSFLPFSIVAIFFIASTLLFFLLRYLFRDPYSRHLIDILRVFLNLPLPTMPSSIRGRLVFGITLISFTVANVIIQSHMNTVLTSSNTARNVENLNDLIDLKYRIYAYSPLVSDLEKVGISNVKSVSNVLNCSQLNKKEAFAGKELTLLPLRTGNCHMPRTPILPGMLIVYYARRNWPIFSKVNKNLLMLFDGGLTDYHIKKVLAKYQQFKQEPDQYQVITMDHLLYTFYGFIILNFISVIVFGIELFIARLSRSIDDVFNHFV